MTNKRKLLLSRKSLNELANNRRNKFLLVRVDETFFWREDIAKKAGKIECVYLIDLSKPTHCCELALSYYAHFISNYFQNIAHWCDKNGDATDELSDMERDSGGEYGRYFTGSSTFNVEKIYNYGKLDDILEYEMCNPTIC